MRHSNCIHCEIRRHLLCSPLHHLHLSINRIGPYVHLDALHPPALPLDRGLGVVSVFASNRYLSVRLVPDVLVFACPAKDVEWCDNVDRRCCMWGVLSECAASSADDSSSSPCVCALCSSRDWGWLLLPSLIGYVRSHMAFDSIEDFIVCGCCGRLMGKINEATVRSP